MNDEAVFSRTEMLLGREAMERLKHSTVAVFGIGGVGGYAAEALIRGGMGTLHFIDMDVVTASNINRQIIADHESIGKLKSDLMRDRACRIHPGVKAFSHPVCFSEDTAAMFDFSSYDYIVDAIDQVSAKVSLILHAKRHKIRIISSMGAANKLDPTLFEVADIFRTSVCPLARIIRRKLREERVDSLKVVYSKEVPMAGIDGAVKDSFRGVMGSVSFVPPVAGFLLASEVIKDLIADR